MKIWDLLKPRTDDEEDHTSRMYEKVRELVDFADPSTPDGEAVLYCLYQLPLVLEEIRIRGRHLTDEQVLELLTGPDAPLLMSDTIYTEDGEPIVN